VVAWYPAEPGGTNAPYLSDLDEIRDGLIASGVVGIEAAGLGLVVSGATKGAEVAAGVHPVIVFSPGNATNVEFYSSIATELASHGFVVIGIDHPYQVGAVLRSDGRVAVYGGDPPLGQAEEVRQDRIEARVEDLGFVLDQLALDAAGIPQLAGHLDLTRIGVMGHSDGGITAAEVCDHSRVDACLNIDGQAAGGPFSVRAAPSAPTKPFLYLTKESELHPALASLFEQAGDGAFRVVIPAASHQSFTDGEMFRPRLTPLNNSADEVMTVARGFAVAFFDHVLRDAPRSVFGEVAAPTDVLVLVYPLEPPSTQ
jgi:dienelactone hydrolase